MMLPPGCSVSITILDRQLMYIMFSIYYNLNANFCEVVTKIFNFRAPLGELFVYGAVQMVK